MLEAGEKAPDFELQDQSGKSVKLSDFKGKNVVVFFYPKDDTPGCTKESIAFSEHLSEFENKNTIILGISKDSVASHEKFCNKYKLNITLLSDPDMKALEPFGAWKEKANYGKRFMGIQRSTFVIDPEGTVLKVWKAVKVDGHVEHVLKVVS